MARARNIKPGFFTNDVLAECSALARILFQGLWCHADREGRLVERPRKLKAEILPYDECNIEDLLTQLAERGFIIRYSHGADRYIQVVNFCKHQNPHVKESESTIPAPCLSGSRPEQAGLIPDSLNRIPDSGLSDPGLPSVSQPEIPAAPKNSADDDETALQAACRETWQAYCSAFSDRYGIDPVRNKTVNAQVKQFVQRLGREESPAVAAFYVRHPQAFYVKSKHQFGLALKDAEGLRTEWATNRIVTDAQARQLDRTGSNLSAADEAIRILEGEVMQ